MSTYTSFAVVGAGGIGTPIVNALLAKKVSIVVLTRPSSSSSKTLPAGVKTAPVEYTDVPSVTAIFKEHKVEVVISTVGYGGLASQNALADAAKAAGVKLFAPSEYGMPTENNHEGLLGVKNKFAEYLKSIGLPSARFYNGFFIGGIPWLTGFSENGKINVVGKGDVPASFTAEEDIAGFIAHVLTTQPPSRLDNAVFRLQGDRATLFEIAEIFKTTAVHVDAVPGPGSEIKTGLLTFLDSGLGSTGWDVVAKKEGKEEAGSTNHLWEGHHWKTIKEVHGL